MISRLPSVITIAGGFSFLPINKTSHDCFITEGLFYRLFYSRPSLSICRVSTLSLKLSYSSNRQAEGISATKARRINFEIIFRNIIWFCGYNHRHKNLRNELYNFLHNFLPNLRTLRTISPTALKPTSILLKIMPVDSRALTISTNNNSSVQVFT